jgi:hypothetical protein
MHMKSLVSIASAFVAVGIAVAACGDDGGSKFGNGTDSDGGGGSFPEGGFGGGEGSAGFDAGDPYAVDPPPMTCVVGDAGAPPPVSGTPDCPSDKNKPGCPCTMDGQTAACWTGLRKNRNYGQCKDGMTTCMKHGEIGLTWGDCVGEVLPDPMATKGAAACDCFSAGQWNIANSSPCFIVYNGDQTMQYGVSTIPDGDGGSAVCPAGGSTPPPVKPSQDWSTDTLKVDCAGHFKLCYQIKAGDYANPLPTDCTVTGNLCVESDYLTKNAVQPFPNIPSWSSPDVACATKFVNSGGYGEMTVIGEDALCAPIDDGKGGAEVFNRVKYCPLSCNGANPDPTMCMNCQQGSSGMF